MPKSYLNLQPPPNPPSNYWLTWTRALLERFIPNNSSKIAGIMGINKAGDIQSLYMPIIVPKAFADEVDASAIIGNVFNATVSHCLFLPTHLTLDQLLSLRPLPMYQARFAPRNLSNPGFLLIRHGQKQRYQSGWSSSQPLHQFSLGKLLSKAAFTIPTLKKRWSPSLLPISNGLSWSKSTSPSKRMTLMTSLPSPIVCQRSLGWLTTRSLQRLASLRPTSLILISWGVRQDELLEFFVGYPSPVC